MDKPRILVIVGATASGKTSLAVALAKQFAGEVISADSRQVYRGLNIGTAKATIKEMQGVPHHLIDVSDVQKVFNAKDFVQAAEQAIDDITSRGKLPIIAGGTFFWVDLLLGRVTMPEVAPNPRLRAKLEKLSTEELYAELRERDSTRAASVDPQNKRRLVRALEIVAALGHVPTIPPESVYNTLWLGLERSKEELRDRYHQRARAWLSEAFKSEIGWLLEQNLAPERLQEFGFEYSVGIAWHQGTITDEEFIEQLVAKNWQYAKRQLQWLKKNDTIEWVQPEDQKTIAKRVTHWLKD